MTAKENKSSEQLCYEIGKRIIDEAVFVYRQTHKLTPDFCVCCCSVQKTIAQLKIHLEQGDELQFICITFRNLMEFTNVYVNIEYVKAKMSL